MALQDGQNASADDIIKSGYNYAADAGSNDTYAVSLPVAPTSYADGLVVRFKANTGNTTGATLNVNSLGAIPILRPDGSALRTNDILANQTVEVIYRGGNFYLISPVGTEPFFRVGIASKNMADGATTQNIAHGLARTPKLVRLRFFALGNGSSTPDILQSDGAFDGTNHACIYALNDWGNSQSWDSSTAFDITIRTASGTRQNGVVSVDATNISIAWTPDAAGSGTYSFIWEAYG